MAMADDDLESATAVDIVRYVYIARELAAKGHTEAAERWQQRIQRWLARHPHRPVPPPGVPLPAIEPFVQQLYSCHTSNNSSAQ
jgi:hypothetical protein